MNILVVYNPNAGKGKALRHAQKLEHALLRHCGTITKFPASSLEIMSNFWRENAGNPKNFDAVALIGGDGTVGPNVDAMIKNNFSAPIYCYGRGTANDFASYFKTNCSPRKAALAIKNLKTVEVNTLKIPTPSLRATPSPCEGEFSYAINVACGGAFTNGVTQYNKKSKRWLGKGAYILHAFFTAFTLKAQPMKYTVVTSDDGSSEQFELDTFLFYILNTKNVGGMKNAAPLADPSDDLLDLVVLKKCGLFGKISLKLNQSFKRIHRCKHVEYIQGKSFHVEHVSGHKIINNFTATDLDGNAAEPYPLEVTLGPKIKVITRGAP